jgi:hypothetical protein
VAHLLMQDGSLKGDVIRPAKATAACLDPTTAATS